MYQHKPHILLLCLNPMDPSDQSSSISCEDLFLIFSVFSPLKKIIIFTKTPVLKAFIEFSSSEGAESASGELHNKKLDNFGKIKLFPSKLKDLHVGTNFLDYKDFSGIDRKIYLKRIQEKLETAKQSISVRKIKENDLENTDHLLSVVAEVSEKEELQTDLSEIVELSDITRTPSPQKENKIQVFRY